ncbi:hypothetical protein CBM2631_A10042 [Cupriavidus taiwanensis]|nr:hypothetical protein CBM2591_A10042 [Cupriavidus taiwanensis]SPA08025.1 hypothetical protein CBM2631_A10042 [Cupriavidus taiwanensis]SPD45008.1 protein of unknown function [Cupriavidus taiwanensis]
MGAQAGDRRRVLVPHLPFFQQEVDKGAHLGRQELAAGVDHADIAPGQLVLRQHVHQTARFDIGPRQVGRKHGHAHVGEGGLVRQFGVAAQQPGADRHGHLAFGAQQRPFVLGNRQAHGDAAMVAQLMSMADRGMRRDIAGRRAEDHLGRNQRARHQVRAQSQVRQHHRHVAAFLDDIDIAVRQDHVEHHLRIKLLEARQQLGQQVQAEHHRRHQAQRAGQRLAAGRDHAFGFLHVFQDLLAALQVGLAGIGQRQAARGPVEQAGAEVAFQVGHVARDHGVGHFQLLRCTREAAQLHHFGKHTHRLQAIHDIVSRFFAEFLRNQLILLFESKLSIVDPDIY